LSVMLRVVGASEESSHQSIVMDCAADPTVPPLGVIVTDGGVLPGPQLMQIPWGFAPG
jgi:hypothetical protein